MDITTRSLRWSNVHLLLGHRAVLFDAGSPGEEDRILRFMADHGVAAEDLALIVLSHGHADHAGSAAALRRRTGAPLVLGAPDTGMAGRGKNPRLVPHGFEARLVMRFVDFPFESFEPDIALDSRLDLVQYGLDGEVNPLPGHTPGSLVLTTGDGQALVGDLLRGGWMGGRLAGRRPKPHYFFDDPAAMMAGLQWVVGRPGVKTLHLGHGGPVEVGRVRRRSFAGG